MKDKQSTNWIIGAILFGGFLLSLWLDLTGLPVHQWLGLAIGLLASYHLAAHWRWVVAVTNRFFGRTSTQARAFYVTDAALAVGFLTILGTGLVISTWFDLALNNYTAWLNVHIVASVATLALVVAKIGLHGRWIVSVARQRILSAQAPAGQMRSSQPVPVAAAMSRRDFLRLMGGVGTVALLAGTNALGNLAESQAAASTAVLAASSAQTASTSQAAASAQTQSAASASTASTSTASACTVRCGKRCSFPGHCGRYTDSNGNGRCDFGECL